MLAAVLFITASAFTVAKIWVLNDRNNNIVLRYQEYNDENGEPVDRSDDLEFQRLMDNLEPGKALVYYNATQKQQGLNVLSTYPKPVKYSDLDKLIEDSGIDFAIPSELPEGYSFSEGDLSYEPLQLSPEVIDKLIDEAEKSDKNTAALEWESTTNVLGVNLVYKNNEKKFTVGITVFKGEDLYTGDLRDSVVEKMILGGREILYIEKESVKKAIMRELHGQGTVNSYLHYSILSKDLSKEELLNVVQSMIP